MLSNNVLNKQKQQSTLSVDGVLTTQFLNSIWMVHTMNEMNAAIAVPELQVRINDALKATLNEAKRDYVSVGKNYSIIKDGNYVGLPVVMFKNMTFKELHILSMQAFEAKKLAVNMGRIGLYMLDRTLSEPLGKTSLFMSTGIMPLLADKKTELANLEFRIDHCKFDHLLKPIVESLSSVAICSTFNCTAFNIHRHVLAKLRLISAKDTAKWDDRIASVACGEGAYSFTSRLLGTNKIIKYWFSERDTENYRYIRNCMLNRTEDWMPHIYAMGKIRLRNYDGSIEKVVGFSVMDELQKINEDIYYDSYCSYIREQFMDEFLGLYRAMEDMHMGNIMQNSEGHLFITDPLSSDTNRAGLQW